jgi:putative transposase
MGGHRKRVLEPYRAFVLERLSTVPDLTMPALVAELAELGVVAHPVTVWRLVRSEGLRFKKNTVRHRAGSAGNRAAASTVEGISGSD